MSIPWEFGSADKMKHELIMEVKASCLQDTVNDIKRLSLGDAAWATVLLQRPPNLCLGGRN
jgi:hypothetical protein